MNTIDKDFLRDPVFPECPIRNVLARISTKWSLAVLYTLDKNNGPMRFKDIERANPDISQKMLTSTLRGLEADGLISRTVFPEMPPRVEYALTGRGHSFMPVMRQLLDWAYTNLNDILSDREHFVVDHK
jgi:DNA-binding HxlR family transcriptional regulator